MDITQAVSNLGSDYVSKVQSALQQATTQSATSTATGDETFDSIYSSVSSLLNTTNEYIQTAQQAEIDYALGNMTNTHELGVYQQQANIALQFTVAVRDKALDAYKEIMNMQI